MKRKYTPGQLAKRARRKHLRDAYVPPAPLTLDEKALIKDARIARAGDSKILRRRNVEEKLQELAAEYTILKREKKGKRRGILRTQQKFAALKRRFKLSHMHKVLSYA